MPASPIGTELKRLIGLLAKMPGLGPRSAKCAALLCLIFLAGCASEASVGAPANVENALTPRLVAISVEDIDASVAWYEQVLGFTTHERYEFPDDGMRMAFLHNSGFELELIELAGAASYDAPNADNPSTRRGFNKLAFHTQNIDARYAHVNDVGAKVHTALRDSQRLGRYFIVLDPDGNWIQVFGE